MKGALPGVIEKVVVKQRHREFYELLPHTCKATPCSSCSLREHCKVNNLECLGYALWVELMPNYQKGTELLPVGTVRDGLRRRYLERENK